MTWMLLSSFLCTFVWTVRGNPQIFFPDKQETLPSPEVCGEGVNYCGGELSKYPADEIMGILENIVRLNRSGRHIEHFFRPLSAFDVREESNDDKDTIELAVACPSRTELIPRFTRAKNVLGKWLYLVEGTGRQRQEVEVTICECAGATCQNDSDSPHGIGTTLCKQLYRTQKLVAIDEQGEVVVDTFDLPSACVCNYKDVSFGFRKGSTSRDVGKMDCRSETITPLSTLEDERNVDRVSGEEKRFSSVMKEPEPCRREATIGGICINMTRQRYPEQAVRSVLRGNSATFLSPSRFEKLFSMPSCQLRKPVTFFRIGFSVDESPLCSSHQSYIFPQVAKNLEGLWKYIINTKEYKQGVTVEVCNSSAEDGSCRYGGTEGNVPEATVCKQTYTRHNMLTITPKGTISYDTFLIPSACVCHIKDTSFFDYI